MTTRNDQETENQTLRREAMEHAGRIADDLEGLAERIRLAARQFSNETIPAAAVVAEIVNTYTQNGNATGARFWSMVRELSRMR
jgi:cell division septum initiation protein DivIVA